MSEPLLDLEDIQGNILAGFNKDVQILLGISFRSIPAARSWIARIEPFIASTAQVHLFNQAFRLARRRLGADPPGMTAAWAHVAFSAPALRALTSDAEVDALGDEAFLIGMPPRAAARLGDPVDPADPGSPAQWLVGAPGAELDALLIIAADREPDAARLAKSLAPQAKLDGKSAPRVTYRETGRTRAAKPGHEHFGFRDGLSQPAVRGLTDARDSSFLEPRWLDTTDPDAAIFARPGTPLVYPGHFIFGQAQQSPLDGSVIEPDPLPFEWHKNGSLLAFRRLRQDVPAFNAFVAQVAARLAARGVTGATTDFAGALLVGRWPSGAPVMRSPTTENTAMGANACAMNNFIFNTDGRIPALNASLNLAPDTFPASRADPSGLVCPFASHVRKVNPRDQHTEFGDDRDTLTRLMLRRGIPYGPDYDGTPASGAIDRGLLFIAYQRSLTEQFETISHNWCNSDLNPVGGGHDPIIGQSLAGPRRFEIRFPNGQLEQFTIPGRWVTPTGGGYFFSPGLRALRGRLSKNR